ncbi:MAG: DUF559 domain-containing protein [Acidimicrobiia bacterium]
MTVEGLEFVDELLQVGPIARPHHSDFARRRSRELRGALTISEARLWSVIRRGATGARFRRQVPIGRWIADFASLDPRIVVEVDGASHEWGDETERTSYLESQGFTVLRFDNELIADEVDLAFRVIKESVRMLRAQRED